MFLHYNRFFFSVIKAIDYNLTIKLFNIYIISILENLSRKNIEY